MCKVMRWEHQPGSLQVTAEDLQRTIHDLEQVNGLQGSPGRLFGKLESVDPSILVGTP